MLEIQDHDQVREIRMSRPPVNALDPKLVSQLRQTIVAAENDSVAGIVLSGGENVFSAGLDLPTLLTLDREAMHAFWRDFFALCAALARSSMPVVAAVGGHAPAGGAVLALMCDYRIMGEDPEQNFRIGLNETQVGLIVPECIQIALRRLVGRYPAERLLMAGAMLTSAEALSIGMVDELAAPDQVRARALAWLQELLALPRHAMLGTRTMARGDLREAFADTDKLPVDDFLDVWFAPPTQAVLQQVVAQLKG